MRVTYFLTALLPLALASTFALEPRADKASTVLKDLKALTTDTNALNTTINAFADSAKPSDAQVLKVNAASNKVSKAIKKCTKDAKASSAFTVAESKEIFTFVANTLQTDTITVLQNFINHFPGFNKGGFAPTVKSGLQAQMKLVKAQAAAISANSQEPYKDMGVTVTNNILAKFTQAINAYSK